MTVRIGTCNRFSTSNVKINQIIHVRGYNKLPMIKSVHQHLQHSGYNEHREGFPQFSLETLHQEINNSDFHHHFVHKQK